MRKTVSQGVLRKVSILLAAGFLGCGPVNEPVGRVESAGLCLRLCETSRPAVANESGVAGEADPGTDLCLLPCSAANDPDRRSGLGIETTCSGCSSKVRAQ